jgi:hypothetical protein
MARRAKEKQMTDDIQFTMVFESNNDDGSANYKLDLNEYTTGKLVEIGVISLLKEHIEQERAKRESLYNRAKSFLRKLFVKEKPPVPVKKPRQRKAIKNDKKKTT